MTGVAAFLDFLGVDGCWPYSMAGAERHSVQSQQNPEIRPTESWKNILQSAKIPG
jgi:hypothetical protein